MAGQARGLIGTSSIYALGLGLNRVLDFALLPLYTNFFEPSEYGAVALTLTLLAFGHIVYAMGFGPAFIWYFTTHAGEQRDRMFSGATLVLLISALILSAVVCGFAPAVGGLFGLENRCLLVDLAAGVLVLDVLTLLPYSLLRAEARAGVFVACTFATTVVQVCLTAALILFAGMGAEGIFIAMVASSSVNVVLVTWQVRRHFRFRGPFVFPRELLRFGLPFVPAGLATVAVELIDRIILERLLGTEVVGVYSAGYRIAAVMGLLVKAFDYAWMPYLLEHRNDAARTARGTLMRFGVLAGVLWLGFWFYGDALLGIQLYGRNIIGPAYRAGAVIIPTIMFGYILAGMAEITMAGVYVRGRAGIVPVAAITAAVVNIGGNYALIPVYGMIGAAYATVGAYGVLSAILFLYTRRALRPGQEDVQSNRGTYADEIPGGSGQ